MSNSKKYIDMRSEYKYNRVVYKSGVTMKHLHGFV